MQNAWFESVSGFTTCGATILDNVEALPKSLLFWRASTHFIGGLGVVVFLLLIIPESSPMRMRLTNMELTELSRSGYSTRPNRIVYIFAYVYLALFAAATICYSLAGMDPFDAVCHGMSVAATGGFSTKARSIGAFDSKAVEALTMVFMYLASIHFGLIYIAFVTRSLRPLKNPVIKFYTLSIIVTALILSVGLHKSAGSWGDALWQGFFSTLCISSTTGFAIVDNASWPMWMMVLMMLTGVMCGSAGSTSGGVKVDRVLLLFKSIGRYVNNILHPSSVNEVRMGRRVLGDSEVSPHLLYLCVYALLALVSVFLCMSAGVDTENSFVATVMSLSNVGPGCGVAGTMGSFNSFPLLGKLIFSLDMFIGRVEIYPVLAVIAMVFDRRKG